MAVHEVVDRDHAVLGDLQSDHMGLKSGSLGRFGRRDVPAATVVARDLAARLLRGAHLREALLGAEAKVRRAVGDERRRALLIEGEPFGLHVRSGRPALARALVPVDAHPVEAVVDAVDRARDEPLLIGVLDPQDELPFGIVAGEEVVVERGTHASDVQRAGRRWRETHADAHVCRV